jgi:hypothetical protein
MANTSIAVAKYKNALGSSVPGSPATFMPNTPVKKDKGKNSR